MKKFDLFLENIGLKNTATGEKKPLGNIITMVALIVLGILLLTLANSYIQNKISKKPKGDFVFSLNGTSSMVLYVGQEYVEQGFVVKNEYGTDLSNKVITIGSVNTNEPGIYEITYKLNMGSTILMKTRTITVIDKTEIIFALLGEEEVTIKQGSKYYEDGYVIILPGENAPENYITVTGNVDINIPGTYRIVYKIEHPNITKELIRIVKVV